MSGITKDTPLKDILEIGKECDMCGHCCSHGAGFIARNEIPKIAKHLGIKEEDFISKYCDEVLMFNNKVYKFKLRKEKGKPYGKCILYSKKEGCKIHDIKPLHCRIGNCKEHGEELTAWFIVNYLVNPTDPESLRQFNIYIKTGGKTIPGGKLTDLVKDKKKLKKILDYGILR